MSAQFRLPADAYARLGAAALSIATALECSVAEAVGGRAAGRDRQAGDATALRHLDKLLSYGLVTRTADAEDGRRSGIGLTPATRAAITELMERLYEPG